MVVSYTATVRSDASVIIGDEGNQNNVSLIWSRTSDGYYNMLEDRNYVYTYGVDLTKTFSDDKGNFKKVEFTLQNKADDYYVIAEKSEKDGKYYVSFRNGEKEYKDLEIGKNVYEAFNTFELQDVSHMNVVDRHLEQSEIWDSSLYERIFQKEESVEDTVLNKLETERLHSAIQQLSEIQRRRLMKYYFEDKNYEQIAQEEGCSFQMVAKSVKAAIRNLKKILR